MNCDSLLHELTIKCENLFYRGESSEDSQTQAFQSPNTVRGSLTPTSFLKSLGLAPLETSIEERSFETVTNNQINLEEGAGLWEDMKSYLEANLTDLRAFVVGETQVKIYLVGLLDGYAIGIFCEAIET